MSEETFRIGCYLGTMLGVGYGTVFGYGPHTWLVLGLSGCMLLYCSFRAIKIMAGEDK
jgi:hypothetical protein